jgi:hypothetical protein
MLVAGVGEQQAHRHGLRLQPPHRAHHPIDFRIGQRDDHFTGRTGPLNNGHYQLVRHERFGAGDGQVVERGTVLPGDLQHIGEPVGGHQHRPGD